MKKVWKRCLSMLLSLMLLIQLLPTTVLAEHGESRRFAGSKTEPVDASADSADPRYVVGEELDRRGESEKTLFPQRRDFCGAQL